MQITRFLTHHENTELYKDPPPGPIVVPKAELSAIAALTDDEIVDLLLATNYMGVNQLRDFICQHIANLIKVSKFFRSPVFRDRQLVFFLLISPLFLHSPTRSIRLQIQIANF